MAVGIRVQKDDGRVVLENIMYLKKARRLKNTLETIACPRCLGLRMVTRKHARQVELGVYPPYCRDCLHPAVKQSESKPKSPGPTWCHAEPCGRFQKGDATGSIPARTTGVPGSRGGTPLERMARKMTWWIWLLIGLFVGCMFGVFATALVSLSRDCNYPEIEPSESEPQ